MQTKILLNSRIYSFLIFSALIFLAIQNNASLAMRTHYSQAGLELDSNHPLNPHFVSKLSDSYIERLHNSLSYAYPTLEELKNDIENLSIETCGDKLVSIGNFIYNSNIIVGYGGEGTVYLGWDNQTKSYVAVKIAPYQDDKDAEYHALEKLGRLYACYSNPSSDGVRRDYYTFMPLINGNLITYYNCFSENSAFERLGVRLRDNKELTYTNWNINARLITSFIDELEYFGSRGVGFELHPTNIMVTEDHKVVFIDVHLSKAKKPDEINLHPYYRYVQYMLGLTPFLVTRSPNKFIDGISVPKAINEFNDEITRSHQNNTLDGFYSLTQFKHAFDILRIKMKTSVQESVSSAQSISVSGLISS